MSTHPGIVRIFASPRRALARALRAERLAMTVAAAGITASTIAVTPTMADEPALCPDLLYLIAQSTSGFDAQRGAMRGDLGGHDANHILAGAEACTVVDDAEKASYRCVWRYPLGNQQALDTFQRFTAEVRACLGDAAVERTDRSVSHPDFYASAYFELASGAVSVNLKNKSQQMSTLVSIRIDGAT